MNSDDRDRLVRVETEVKELRQDVRDLVAAVIGTEDSRRKPITERVASLEARVPTRRHRMAAYVTQIVVATIAATLGVHLPHQPS